MSHEIHDISAYMNQVGQQARGLEEERLDLGFVESRQVCSIPVYQSPSTAVAALGEYRNPRTTQGIHITIDGPLRHFQPLGQLTRRHPLADLEEQ